MGEVKTMEIRKGLVIHPGIAWGKAHIWAPADDQPLCFDLHVNQKELLQRALDRSTRDLEETISSAEILYPETISVIFEAHKLMANDPLLLEEAFERIEAGENAYQAYGWAAQDIISRFRKLDNEYMRNRIVDIEDATDRVLSAITETAYERALRFPEPRILVIPKMKPSILINCHPDSIPGFVSAEGAYDQHSGTIARTKDLPGVVVPDILRFVRDGDGVLVDGNSGMVYLNPTEEVLSRLLSETTVKP